MPLVTHRRQKSVTKIGRPTLRKNGVPFSAAEKMRRYRARLKRNRPPKNTEWYTPKRYIEASRKVLGRIDLDPASSDIAQTVVRANVYYTFQDNGLSKPWHNNVFLNPPYSPRQMVRKFVDKLLQELAAGHVKQAILLVHSRSSGTKWFQRAAAASKCFCLPERRIICWSANSDGNSKSSPPSGSMFLYYGCNMKRFQAVFKKFGLVR
jgi:DNA N-6-adenine-methyltransferase (Dam)